MSTSDNDQQNTAATDDDEQVVGVSFHLIIQLEASFRRILDSLWAQFGSVHAYGYSAAESELIWMKSGALRVHCWGLGLADFGHGPRTVCEAGEI